ncbi:MAG TPA: tetratricopeptide repeat protein, partial [Puia sp.]|nr:tetratricopeptide repeat protein [Puia sp.]
MRPFYSVLVVLLLGIGAVQGRPADSPPAKASLNLLKGDHRIRQLLAVAGTQLFLASIYHRSFDSALLCIRQATQLADSLGSFRLLNECRCTMARYYLITKGVPFGRNYMMQLIAACRQRGDPTAEAHCWRIMGNRLPRVDSNYSLKISAFHAAFDLCRQANDAEGALQVFSEWEQLEQSYHRKMSPDMLLSAAALYLYKNYDAAYIHYSWTLKDSIKRTDLPRWFCMNYLNCEACFRIGFWQSSLPGARICLDLAGQQDYPELYYIARLVVTGLIKKGSTQEALRLMQQITRDHPPRSALEDRAVSWCYGMIYDRLGQPAEAERYFRRVRRQDSGFANQPKSGLILSLFFQPAESAIGIGEFYLRRGKFHEARDYLQRVVDDPLLGGQVSDKRAMELILFRASQALGDYQAAMQYHKKYEEFNDSMIRNQKFQLVWAGLLRTNAEIQHFRIFEYDRSAREEKANLKRARFERNIILAASSILLLASGF